jgi:hypothetical protein
MFRRSLLLLALSSAACVPAAHHRALEARVGELEGVIARLRTVVVVPATPEDEAAARDLTDRITEALQAHDQLAARALVQVLVRDYPDTRPARSIGQLYGRLSALGGEVADPAAGGFATEVSLFDPAAPYFAVYLSGSCQVCPQVAANAQQARAELDGRVQVVAVVAAEEKAYAEALAAQGVAPELPILIDAGPLRRALGAATTPHAALVVDGKVVWIGDHLIGHADVVARLLPAE